MARPTQELLDDLSVKIYDDPYLASLRNNGAVADLRSPLHVVMLLLDFDTEVSMNGIVDFLGNSSGRYADETVTALEVVGCPDDAAALREVLGVAAAAGMTRVAIQEDLSHVEPYTVTSFRQLHGTKWDEALTLIRPLEGRIDSARIWARVVIYMEPHRSLFETALAPRPKG